MGNHIDFQLKWSSGFIKIIEAAEKTPYICIAAYFYLFVILYFMLNSNTITRKKKVLQSVILTALEYQPVISNVHIKSFFSGGVSKVNVENTGDLHKM